MSRVVGSSSHPSIASIGDLTLPTLNGHFLSAMLLRFPLIVGRRGCAAIEVLLQEERQSATKSTIASESDIYATHKLCSDSVILPSDPIIHIAKGGIIRAKIDPERHQNDNETALQLPLQLRLTSKSIQTVLIDVFQCPIETIGMDTACAVGTFLQKIQLSTWKNVCGSKERVTIPRLESIIRDTVISEVRSLLSFVFPVTSTGWSIVSQAISVSSIQDAAWVVAGRSCSYENTGVDVKLVLYIERRLLKTMSQLTHRPAILSLLSKLWNTLAEPPSSLHLHLMKTIDWTTGAHLVPDITPREQWSSSSSQTISVDSDGYISGHASGVAQVNLNWKPYSGSLNVHVRLEKEALSG